MGIIELHLGDCIEYMNAMEKESVNAIITDPPYNVSKKGAKIVRGKGTAFEGGDISLDFGEWDMGIINWSDYIDLFAKILCNNGILVMFYDKLHLGNIGLYLQEKYDFQVRHIGAMVKTNPAPQARRVKWQNGLEQFIVVTKNKGEGHHFNYRMGQSPDYFMTNNGYEHMHPTQKPISVMNWIVQYWSFEGDTVFDPFMGSGTTGVSCIQFGRNFIGCEIDPSYYDIAKKRIEGAQPPLLLTDKNLDKQWKQPGLEQI